MLVVCVVATIFAIGRLSRIHDLSFFETILWLTQTFKNWLSDISLPYVTFLQSFGLEICGIILYITILILLHYYPVSDDDVFKHLYVCRYCICVALKLLMWYCKLLVSDLFMSAVWYVFTKLRIMWLLILYYWACMQSHIKKGDVTFLDIAAVLLLVFVIISIIFIIL